MSYKVDLESRVSLAVMAAIYLGTLSFLFLETYFYPPLPTPCQPFTLDTHSKYWDCHQGHQWLRKLFLISYISLPIKFPLETKHSFFFFFVFFLKKKEDEPNHLIKNLQRAELGPQALKHTHKTLHLLTKIWLAMERICPGHQAWMKKGELHKLLHQMILFYDKSLKKWTAYENRDNSKQRERKDPVATKPGWGNWAEKDWH